jgi:hypothetical protein
MTRRPDLPCPRGPLSEAVVDALGGVPRRPVSFPRLRGSDAFGDDAQLALTCCYELHYESFAGVDETWEWDPALLGFRAELEGAFVDRLQDEVGGVRPIPATDVVPALRELASGDGPSLSGWLEAHGTVDHLREFCVHRSEYQRKEADPHTWMIPRLRGRSKAAAVAIQHDEYGEGCASEMHAELFATTMAALDLDPTYGAYRGLLPGSTLATGNLVTMLGLHRRWRAACAGHLALFEMTSVTPMARYATTLARLGFGERARRFYDVHVAADAWHEQIAQHELVGGLLADEPDTGSLVLFGARALMHVERAMAERMLDAWAGGITSLLAQLPARVAA